MKNLSILPLTLLLILAACSPAYDPPPPPDLPQVSQYPQSGASPIGSNVYPGGTHGQQVLYSSRLELTVWNLERAVEETVQIAAAHGGYVVSADTRLAVENPFAALKIAFPAENFEAVRADLLDLGDLRGEQLVSSTYPPYGQETAGQHTSVELHLQPRLSAAGWERLGESDSRALRTFAAAANLLWTLLAFLFDAAIWLLVVAGPFALAWWAGRRVMQRLQRRTGVVDISEKTE